MTLSTNRACSTTLSPHRSTLAPTRNPARRAAATGRFPKRTLSAVAAAVLAATAGAQTQAAFTTFGSGCNGAAGTATLTGVGVPYLGERFFYDLDNVPANGIALRVLGAASPGVPIPGMPGCSLYAALEAIEVAFTDANGHARFYTDIPTTLSLAGQHFYLQGAAFDASANSVGIVVSNGGDMLLGVRPAPNILSFSPTTVGPDGVVQITGTNFPTDGGSICLRAFDPNNNNAMAFLRVDSVVQNGGVQVITAHVELVDPAFATGTLMMAVGANRRIAVGARTHITEPGVQWAWNGIDAPAAAAVGVLNVVQPDAIASTKAWSLVGGQAQVHVPLHDPCDSSGTSTADWRPRTLITTDLHFNVACPGNAGITHYDAFLKAVTVALAADGGVIADEHVDQLAEALAVPTWGPPAPIEFGRTIDNSTTPPSVILWARPAQGSGCTITGVGGSLNINCPDEQQCLALTREPLTGSVPLNSSAELVYPSGSGTLGNTTSPMSLPWLATDLGVSIDGKTGVASDATGVFTFFDIDSGVPLTTIPADPNFAGARLDVSRRSLNGKGTAIAVMGTRIRAFSLDTLAPAQSITLTTAALTGVAASLHGRYVAAWGGNKVYILEMPLATSSSLVLRHTETINGATVTRVAWNPNVQAIAVLDMATNTVRDYAVDANGSLALLGTSPNLKTIELSLTNEEPRDIAFRPNGNRAYVLWASPFLDPNPRAIVQELNYASGAFVNASAGTVSPWGEQPLPAGADAIAVTDNGQWMMFATQDAVHAYDLSSWSTLVGATEQLWDPADTIQNLVSRKG